MCYKLKLKVREKEDYDKILQTLGLSFFLHFQSENVNVKFGIIESYRIGVNRNES